MIAKKDKNELRMLRHAHVRQRVSGTAARPRLCVFRSLKNIYAQVIDDTKGHTLVSASTLDKEIAAQLAGKDKKSVAKLVGTCAAQRALAAGIKQVVFDRGGYLYTGRVREVAQGAREAGLEF